MRIKPVMQDLGHLISVTPPSSLVKTGYPRFTGNERDAALLMTSGLRKVFDPDTRERVSPSRSSTYPLQTLAFLLIQFEGPEPAETRRATGTGWLASSSTVVTAGHCLYSHAFPGPARRAEWIRAIPSSNRIGEPKDYLDVVPPRILVPPEWQQLKPDGVPNWEYDYGAFHLPLPIGDTLQWMQCAVLTDAQLQQLPTAIVGYPNAPKDKVPKPFGTMWGQIGTIAQPVGQFVYYDHDTSTSQSGSPVYMMYKNTPYVVAIHEAGGDQMNRGLRITPRVMTDLQSWLA